MQKHLAKLGFASVINQRRDFYKDIAEDMVPHHDVLVTNPPYSGDHKKRLLRFLFSQKTGGRPFMLLLPSWTAAKQYWRQFLWALGQRAIGDSSVDLEVAFRRTRGLTAELERDAGCFYVVPSERYDFLHPGGGGHDVAPFHGIWFCGGWPTPRHLEKALKAFSRSQKRRSARAPAPEGEPQSGGEEAPAPCRVLRTLASLRDAGLVATEEEEKRRYEANPELARQRAEALARLDAARKTQPRKRDFSKRQKQAVRFEEGRPLTEEETATLGKQERACRHYYQSEAGCSTGAKCRFRHDVL